MSYKPTNPDNDLFPKKLKVIGNVSEKKFAVPWKTSSLNGSIFTNIVGTSEYNAQGHSETIQFKEGKVKSATPGKSRSKFVPTEELPDELSLLAETLADNGLEEDDGSEEIYGSDLEILEMIANQYIPKSSPYEVINVAVGKSKISEYPFGQLIASCRKIAS